MRTALVHQTRLLSHPVLVISPRARAQLLRKRAGVHSRRGTLDSHGTHKWPGGGREQRSRPGPGDADPREGRPSLVKVKLALTPAREVKEK